MSSVIIRLRSPSGQFRLEISQQESIKIMWEKINKLLGADVETLSSDQNNSGSIIDFTRLDTAQQVARLGLKNGVMLFSNQKALPSASLAKEDAQASVPRSLIKQDPIDDYLLKQPGTIKRARNPQFCKHGDQGMCEYCLPLQPYDAGYLEENKIKHMAFHAYLRQLVESGKIPSPYSPQFIPPLDIPNYSVLKPCPSGRHGAYPIGICSKCQPSAITLQTQNFRMVDHVEFESPSLIENFLGYWRSTGVQRAGYLYGKYEPYEKVPLGVKAVVSCIYEPQQDASHDFIQLDFQTETPLDQAADALAKKLGLQKLGIIYTDLVDDGTGKGTVLCKRHSDSYFMSSSEILLSAYLQAKHPTKTLYSPTGDFGSRFVTVVITGNEQGAIDIQSYQVSNSAVSMARDGIIEASVEPSLMRVSSATPVKYVPDVFFKYKNEYNIMVQEAAKPTFPVEYLLITSSHGFPSQPNPLFQTPVNCQMIENRITSSSRSMATLKSLLSSSSSPPQKMDSLSEFHALLFIVESGVLDEQALDLLCRAVMEKSSDLMSQLQHCDGWSTLEMILQETSSFSAGNNASGGGGGQASGSNDPWSCRHCTFTNMGGATCEMCGLPNE